MDIRKAHVSRKTSETDIELSICLDGTGKCEADTGIGFFDHMLNSFARHGMFDLSVKVQGDLYVDSHHTIEDTGIVLGEAIKRALGDKNGIRRFGYFILPMDETLVLASLDLSGRPYLNFQLPLTVERVGMMAVSYTHLDVYKRQDLWLRCLPEGVPSESGNTSGL